MRLRVWKGKKSCVSSTTMVAGTRKSPTFSTTTTNRNPIPTTNRVVISLGIIRLSVQQLPTEILSQQPTEWLSASKQPARQLSTSSKPLIWFLCSSREQH
uniref:Uncharacterized protein n=1 Tax=Brassica oleracea var. oleracea TaxID=109376 RepID=A0A0D3E6G9_BRAOL